MKFYSILLISFRVCFSMGCSKSGAPSCSDPTVNKTAIELATQRFQNMLTHVILYFKFGITDDQVTYAEFKAKGGVPRYGTDRSNEVVALVDKEITPLRFTIEAVRVVSSDDKIRRSVCAGSLVISPSEPKPFPIVFTAQYTINDELYVEINDYIQPR